MSDGAPSPSPEDAGAGRIVVVGPGRVGQSLAAALADGGRGVTVLGRGDGPPRFLADRPRIRYRREASEGPEAGRVSTLVFCVGDDDLPAVAGAWARRLPARDDGDAPGPAAVALHTSGVHASDVLAPLRSAGWAVAAWHPLTALAAPRTGAFRGVTFGLEGDGPAKDRGRELARAVGGRALDVRGGAGARYHAAAVFASNFLVACLSTAARELDDATGGEGGVEDLLPLARAAVDNVADGDLAGGATGPLTRGDVGTVRRHLEALSGESADLYRRLARELLGVVEGRLAPEEAEEIRRALEGGP